MAKEILLQAAELGSQYGTTAFQEYFEERKNYFLPQLQSILIELNGLYSSTIKEGEVELLLEKRRAEMKRQVESLSKDIIKNVVFPSSRGNADILNKKKMDEELIRARQIIFGARSNIYKYNKNIENDEKLKKIALKGMQIVYALRQELLGEVEEQLAITFAEEGYVKVLTIPMSTFLQSSQALNLISITTESLSKQLYGDPYKITLHTGKSVISTLKDLGAQEHALTINGIEVTKDFYDNLFKSETGAEIYLLRSDKNYFVIKKNSYQSGFIAEALIRASFGGSDFNYQQDSATWYQKPDITIRGQGYSVKNIMNSSPTLLRINSLQTVISDLIKKLSQTNIPAQEIMSEIKSQIFKQASDLETAVDKFGEKMINQNIKSNITLNINLS